MNHRHLTIVVASLAMNFVFIPENSLALPSGGGSTLISGRFDDLSECDFPDITFDTYPTPGSSDFYTYEVGGHGSCKYSIIKGPNVKSEATANNCSYSGKWDQLTRTCANLFDEGGNFLGSEATFIQQCPSNESEPLTVSSVTCSTNGDGTMPEFCGPDSCKWNQGFGTYDKKTKTVYAMTPEDCQHFGTYAAKFVVRFSGPDCDPSTISGADAKVDNSGHSHSWNDDYPYVQFDRYGNPQNNAVGTTNTDLSPVDGEIGQTTINPNTCDSNGKIKAQLLSVAEDPGTISFSAENVDVSTVKLNGILAESCSKDSSVPYRVQCNVPQCPNGVNITEGHISDDGLYASFIITGYMKDGTPFASDTEWVRLNQ